MAPTVGTLLRWRLGPWEVGARAWEVRIIHSALRLDSMGFNVILVVAGVRKLLLKSLNLSLAVFHLNTDVVVEGLLAEGDVDCALECQRILELRDVVALVARI